MSYVTNQDNTRSFTAYSLLELLPEIIQASEEGFELNFEQNSGVPVQFGVVTCLTMFPKKEVAPTEPSLREVIDWVKAEDTTKEQATPVKVDKRRKQV